MYSRPVVRFLDAGALRLRVASLTQRFMRSSQSESFDATLCLASFYLEGLTAPTSDRACLAVNVPRSCAEGVME